MMMSPESYYIGLKGKTAEEILAELDGLRGEIAELKAATRSRNYMEPETMPDKDVRLAMALDYFEMAKKALTEAGGVYVPTEDEQRALDLDARLDGLTALEFSVSSNFTVLKSLSIDFSGGKSTAEIISETDPLCGDGERKAVGKIGRKQLISALRRIRICDWDSVYRCLGIMDGEDWSVTLRFADGSEEFFRGSSAYPFSFAQFCDLIGYEEEF